MKRDLSLLSLYRKAVEHVCTSVFGTLGMSLIKLYLGERLQPSHVSSSYSNTSVTCAITTGCISALGEEPVKCIDMPYCTLSFLVH
jgi:hypothetical protein